MKVVSRRKRNIVLLAACAVLLLPVGLWVLDKQISRPGRIRRDKERVRLSDVRTAIARYAIDNSRFPTDLQELVPNYMSEGMTTFACTRNDRAPIAWDPETGTLEWSTPLKIRSLLPREEMHSLHVKKLPVKIDRITGERVFRQDPKAVKVGKEDIVLEPEMFHAMTYGWQVGEEEGASGHAYLHIPEGIGALDYDKHIFDPARRAGDFYNVGGDRRPAAATLYFMAPRAGRYYGYVRLKAQREHCSNIVKMLVNEETRDYRLLGHTYRQPFIWHWFEFRGGPVTLKNGLNSFTFLTYHDDVKIDQILLTRKYRYDIKESTKKIFVGGHAEVSEIPEDVPPLCMSLQVETLKIGDKKDPEVSIHLHKNAPTAIDALLLTTLDLPNGKKLTSRRSITVREEDRLVRFPCETKLPRPLDRREYLLSCRLMLDGKEIALRTTVLMYDYDWSILGPLPYMSVFDKGPVEKDKTPAKSYSFAKKDHKWQKYDRKHTDHFCVMDFGKMFSGNVYNAKANTMLYAYTEVHAAQGGKYMMKIQADDNIVVWVNGKEVGRIIEYGPAIRTAKEVPVTLQAGKNKILYRLNQRTHQWQAGIRIRTIEDQIADVVGVPFDEQDADCAPPTAQ